ncbi:hypothetical protein [Fluviispira multicolorata]|uniref:Uncharacterized protein n=1 Tax=Fluviispira multicolorata TaxID=2654512 RepID=A0A833N6Y2_9BACT|nr:hypothetical protein [Fluviispira multicolorata]KAB8031013.1 hypothetical protein GCL57_08580 [Fluviispira multicolorata]
MNFKMNNLIFEDGRLTEESILLLSNNSDMIECKCPEKLLKILTSIREFKNYTENCIQLYPDDKKTHEWLTTSANNLDRLLSSTLLQLARLEGFIDEDNNIKKRPE